MIDRQGLLHVGDIIKEVNGHEVGNNPKELQELLKNISGSVTLKILPSYRDTVIPQQVSITFSVFFVEHFFIDVVSKVYVYCNEELDKGVYFIWFACFVPLIAVWIQSFNFFIL